MKKTENKEKQTTKMKPEEKDVKQTPEQSMQPDDDLKRAVEEATYESKRRTRINKLVRMAFLYFILGVFAIIILVPFYWMILTSLKTMAQVTSPEPILFLRLSEMQFSNYRDAVLGTPEQPAPDYLLYMINTVVVAAVSTVGTIITTVLAAFAFARLNFKFKELIFLLLLTTMMIPGEMYIITNFITVYQLGWLTQQTRLDALLALSVPFMTSIFYIFFLRQTFRQIPNELYYAAKVDGTKDFQYLWKIMVPIARPTIITITILNAMGTWNAYIWPQLITSVPGGQRHQLVSNGLRNAYATFVGVDYTLQMSAALVVTAPLLVTFLILKKQIMRGVSRSGIKG